MNKKRITLGLALLLFSTFLWFTASIISGSRYIEKISGDPLFKHTIQSPTPLAKIIIENNNNTTTLISKDNIWRVAEKNNYYANAMLLMTLTTAINEAYIIKKQKSPDESPILYTIKTFDANQNPLDELSFRKNSVQFKDNHDTYTFQGEIIIPNEQYSWLEQPLFEIRKEYIEEIVHDNQRTTGDIERIKGLLEYLPFIEAIPSDSFNFTEAKTISPIKIITHDGLTAELKLFSLNNELYIEKILSTTVLPTKQIHNYVKSNTFLYKNWLFKIKDTYAEILTSGIQKENND